MVWLHGINRARRIEKKMRDENPQHKSNTLARARRRYARGEISREEYDDIRKNLESERY